MHRVIPKITKKNFHDLIRPLENFAPHGSANVTN